MASTSPPSPTRSARTRSRQTSRLTNAFTSRSPSPSPSRRSRRSRAEDTLTSRPSRQRAAVPDFEESGRGRSRVSPARAVTHKEQTEMDYSADMEGGQAGSELELDEADDLFFGDFCFTCGAPLSLAPSSSSPSSTAAEAQSHGYCSALCMQSSARRSPFGLGVYDSPAIPAFGRSEDGYSTSPSSASSAPSPSPFNALGHHQLRSAAQDEPTLLSLPQSVTSFPSPTKSIRDSTPTHRKLNFDYAYALSTEPSSDDEAQALALSPLRATALAGDFDLGTTAFQSVDSMLHFRRRSSVVAPHPSPSPFAVARRPRQTRKSSISSVLSLGLAAAAEPTVAETLSHAHRGHFAGSPDRTTVPARLPASPTLVRTCA